MFIACLELSCGSGAAPPASLAVDAGGTTSADDAGPRTPGASASAITETGTLIDYESMEPVAGLTITDNGVSATTDAKGVFTLVLPATATLLSPKVTGPKYSTLLFPQSSPMGDIVDYGENVIPDSATYSLEQTILRNDQTMALVQVVVKVSGSCASAEGGSLSVLSPAGAQVAYFSTSNVPNSSITTFQAVESPRAVAAIYDIPVGAALSLAVTHPTCTMVPFPAASSGQMLNGKVTTMATEPNDVNGAVVIMLQ